MSGMREIVYTVPQSFEGAQAQDYLKALGFSRRALIRLKNSGGLSGSGGLLRMVDLIHAGDRIIVRLPEESASPLSLLPNNDLYAPIVYQDEDVVVFNKPPFMPVHPSIRHYDDTLANLFTARFPGLVFRPVNRLDRNTSGLCVCARSGFAAAALSKSVEKVYYAITDGIPPGNTVDQPIGRTDSSIIKRCVTPEGKPAVTHFNAVGGNGRRALLRITLETGRTHQIRVHMAYLGFPLCGDEMYGGDCSGINRQALHCGEVSFTQPVTHERIKVTAPLPEDMSALLCC